jgi:iron complex outermembrane receptor protein
MKFSFIFLLSAGFLPAFVHAADASPARTLAPVVVKASAEPVTPAVVLGSRELDASPQTNLGALLEAAPGVSSTYFGPNAGRPIVRGLDGDRLRIVQNGTALLDASSVSPDHAVGVDPLAIRSVEVLRGPSALLYSTSILGGVINLVDNRVPTELMPARVTLLGRAGSADGLRATSLLAEGSTGRWAYHADAFHKTTDDLRTPVGVVADTAGTASGAGAGFAYVGQAWRLGFAYSGLDSSYGVAEPDLLIGLHQRRWDLAAAVERPDGFVRGLEAKVGFSDYDHAESEGGVAGTRFANRGWDGRVDLSLGGGGGFKGVAGVSGGNADFSVNGAEAFLPSSRTTNFAAFGSFTQPLADGLWQLRSGFRCEAVEAAAADWNRVGVQAAHPAEARSFAPVALSLGLVRALPADWETAVTLSRTERAPNMQELYADGPHMGTGSYEVGDRNLGLERAVGLELGLTKTKGPITGGLSAYYNRFSSYVAQRRHGDGPDLTLAGGDDFSGLARYDYAQVPADLYGFEAKAGFALGAGRRLELFGDTLNARQRDTGEPLPRISPGRLGVALQGADLGWTWRVDCTYHLGQRDIAVGETTTAGYALVGVSLTRAFKAAGGEGSFGLRVTNIFDAVGRDASSFLKDTLALPGRGVEASLRLNF